MCSGARSSSANGAIAARAAPASSWSTSSSTVLSDCTIKGPSVTGATLPRKREVLPPHLVLPFLRRRRHRSPLSFVRRHDRRDAVDGEFTGPAGRRVERHEL